MVVMKFGGTSVADRAAIERLMAIVRAERQAEAQREGGDPRGPIVVVSALSGVTEAHHQRVRERPRLAAEVPDVRHVDPDLLAHLARDALLERLAGVDEAREHAVHDLRRPAPAAGEQDLVSPRDPDDDRRRDARERQQAAGGTLVVEGLEYIVDDQRNGLVARGIVFHEGKPQGEVELVARAFTEAIQRHAIACRPLGEELQFIIDAIILHEPG